ncbi:MAG: sulfotransferase family 2 domain-containing protein [Shimia sp.]|uniref:sulfotransferase family 2 domain-containing protein n=1 Tax=Shimia sp. TaxID=1954381 RepID=UPI003B8B004B
MISKSHRFIYLHVPKTGGNAIQTALLPISEDASSRARHQDGVDRFGITGPRTPRKHALLSEYKTRLGEPLEQYRVVISVRHPFPRALSMYFSPGRWLKETSIGEWEPQEPQWNEHDFLSLIQDRKKLRPIVDFLKLGGVSHTPDVTLRHETLHDDYMTMCREFQLPSKVVALPQVNRSSVSRSVLKRLLESQILRDATESAFGEDMSHFGYDTFPVLGRKAWPL